MHYHTDGFSLDEFNTKSGYDESPSPTNRCAPLVAPRSHGRVVFLAANTHAALRTDCVPQICAPTHPAVAVATVGWMAGGWRDYR